jgi:hypothetical protein
MAKILLVLNTDMSREHSDGLLEDIANHVHRYNPRVITKVTATTEGTPTVVEVVKENA